jgi:hypothetical protein
MTKRTTAETHRFPSWSYKVLIAAPFKKTSTASPSQVLCFRVCGCLLVHAFETVFIQMRSSVRTIEPSNTAPRCCCPPSLTRVSFDWTENQNHRICAFVQSQPMVEKQTFAWMSEETILLRDSRPNDASKILRIRLRLESHPNTELTFHSYYGH